MRTWKHVRWTEARQVTDLLGWPAEPGDKARVAPEVFFKDLIEAGRLTDAAFFLGQALPRFETVAWAARAVRDLAPEPTLPEAEVDALRAALLWVQDPSDARRRASFEAAGKVREACPARIAALAVYFSGGSITPDEAPQTQPPKEMAGRLAAGAVLLAAAKSGQMQAALTRALGDGARIAEKGIAAA
jgi:hypothetical protein